MKTLFVIIFALFAFTASAKTGDWPKGTYGPYVLKNIRVIDGDTFEADILVWPGITLNQKIRLNGWDTPELHSSNECEREKAKEARDLAWKIVKVVDEVWLSDVRGEDSFGRVIGTMTLLFKGQTVSLGFVLSQRKLARPWPAEKGKPWCGAEL